MLKYREECSDCEKEPNYMVLPLNIKAGHLLQSPSLLGSVNCVLLHLTDCEARDIKKQVSLLISIAQIRNGFSL